MLRLRPYKKEDADTIISWSQDERAFYRWSAGIIGAYPVTQKEFEFVDSLMAFSAFDEEKLTGFFTLRNPGGKIDELRIGFVILNPEQRGCGKGKEMLRLALKRIGIMLPSALCSQITYTSSIIFPLYSQ